LRWGIPRLQVGGTALKREILKKLLQKILPSKFLA